MGFPASQRAYDRADGGGGLPRFSIDLNAQADLSLRSNGLTGNPTLAVFAVGNSWSLNRAPCNQTMKWSDVPDGTYQIAVEPTAGAVVQEAGQICGTD